MRPTPNQSAATEVVGEMKGYCLEVVKNPGAELAMMENVRDMVDWLSKPAKNKL